MLAEWLQNDYPKVTTLSKVIGLQGLVSTLFINLLVAIALPLF
jgi:hypothetical protein